jgi:hydrogenase assembly chaperone HypC/HupF
MCIAFPGLVLAVDADGQGATVETEGRRRRASTFLVPDIAVGDWVSVAAGTIVDRLSREEAAEVQALVVMVRGLDQADATHARGVAHAAPAASSPSTDERRSP